MLMYYFSISLHLINGALFGYSAVKKDFVTLHFKDALFLQGLKLGILKIKY